MAEIKQTTLLQRLGLLPRLQLPGKGIYHYLRQDGDSKTRLHLRLEEDGKGTLLVNASRLYHFNATAALMAYQYLQGAAEADVLSMLTRYYHVDAASARADYQAFLVKMQAIVDLQGLCPLCDLELETSAPFSQQPSAPYRMDLALTYRCNNNCAHCYNARPRQQNELSTAQWKQILDKLWDIGVPHIVFTGGEPTLRDDLPELVAYAEKKGQITGINTNGRRLKYPDFVKKLVDAGLDHVQITYESHIADIHDRMVAARGAWVETEAGLKNALQSALFVMTNTTLLQENSQHLEATLDALADLKVPTIGLNALIYSGGGLTVGTALAEKDLPPLLELARARTDQRQQRLIWYTPTQYCHFDPVQMQLGVKGCTAALYNMCVEPDGSALPCQSYYHSLGNMLTTPWDAIWNHDLALSLRQRRDVPAACQECLFLQECGGGCPLARAASRVADPVSQRFYPI